MSAPENRRPGDPPLVAGSIGYFFQVTPGTSPLDATRGRPCDAVMVDTFGAVVTGKRGALGSADTATAGPPLANGIWHPMSYYTITAVSAGNVWVGYYSDPALDVGNAGWGPVVAS